MQLNFDSEEKQPSFPIGLWTRELGFFPNLTERGESAGKMAKKEILVVDDEEDIRELVTFNLTREGYVVRSASSGEEALDSVKKQMPHLIILDLMLPGMDGLEVARKLKKDSSTEGIPVVMLTAKGEEADIVAGLELGADDYVTKPFSPRVLTARVKTVLRRKAEGSPPGKESPLKVHELEIHPGRHEVLVQGKPIPLTFTEFAILKCLAQRPCWVFTRYQIVDAVHGREYNVTERSVDVQVAGLRKKLGRYGKYVETVRGVGYRFKE
jgi:two-component system alkaline phosphatase synthesis response regulator PhoP